MKKSIILFLLTICVLTVFGQADTVVVDNGPTEIPDWISYAINAILTVLAVWLGKAKVRLSKAVTLLDTLSKAIDRGTVSSSDIRDVVDQAKDLVAKEK